MLVSKKRKTQKVPQTRCLRHFYNPFVNTSCCHLPLHKGDIKQLVNFIGVLQELYRQSEPYFPYGFLCYLTWFNKIILHNILPGRSKVRHICRQQTKVLYACRFRQVSIYQTRQFYRKMHNLKACVKYKLRFCFGQKN